MSNIINGTTRLISIYFNDIYYPVGCLTSNSFSEESEMLETTTRQNTGGWRSSVPTKQSYSISFSGLVTTDNKSGTILTYNDLQTLKRDRTLISWKINSEVSGLSDFGKGYIRSISNNAEVDSFIDFTCEIEGFGKPIFQADTQEGLNYTLNFGVN